MCYSKSGSSQSWLFCHLFSFGVLGVIRGVRGVILRLFGEIGGGFGVIRGGLASDIAHSFYMLGLAVFAVHVPKSAHAPLN